MSVHFIIIHEFIIQCFLLDKSVKDIYTWVYMLFIDKKNMY